MGEAAFQQFVVEFAEWHKWRVMHIPDSRRAPASAKGAPDLILFRPVKMRGIPVLYRELKTDNGRLTPEQELWGKHLRSLGLDWGVWRPKHWEQIKRILSGRVA